MSIKIQWFQMKSQPVNDFLLTNFPPVKYHIFMKEKQKGNNPFADRFKDSKNGSLNCTIRREERLEAAHRETRTEVR